MTQSTPRTQDTQIDPLAWAERHQAALTVSILPESDWNHLRSQIVQYDAAQGLLQIIYPIVAGSAAPAEITPGLELGITFRRGHKKCILVAKVLARRSDQSPDGRPLDTLLLRAPHAVREMQRRLYQRVTVPADRWIGVKLWQGGRSDRNEDSWPISAGRLSNISLGGALVEIRSEQNPRLTMGERVGIEIIVRPESEPVRVEAQYRHCMLLSNDHLGLGLQFIGLEKDAPGRTTMTQIAELVRELRGSGIGQS